jgi:hypothetical protein
LERLAAFSMDRELARIQPKSAARESTARKTKAAARHMSGAMPLGDVHRKLCPWNAWLELRNDLRSHVVSIGKPMCEVITRRFGLDGTRPQSCKAIARQTDTTPIRVVRVGQRGIRELRRLLRESKGA